MQAVGIPRAPRAMARQEDDSSSTLSQVFNSAAKKLYPRLVLYEALTKFEDGPRSRTRSDDDLCEERRDFLDSFAYLCDVEKGGATVTAAALEKLSQGNILWLAANEGLSREVKAYANRILVNLKRLSQHDHDTIENDIFQLAVVECSLRIGFYKDEMQKYAKQCRMQLRQEVRDDAVKNLRSMLKKLSEPPPSVTTAKLVDLCYDVRRAELELIKVRSKDEGDDFGKLAHYIGRLGATRSSAKAVVRAVTRVSALQQISAIRAMEAPNTLLVELDSRIESPYEIVRAICMESGIRSPMDVKSALHAIVDYDMPPNSKIRGALEARKSITTRVHAELQITDAFSRSQRKFVDDDKYVGCSKPACYFCYNWICEHNHHYNPPATHRRIITGCRGPDNDINRAGLTVLRSMYTKMCNRLNHDILAFLLHSEQKGARPRYHFMSTEGSSYPASQI